MKRRAIGFGMLLGMAVVASGLATACGSDGAGKEPMGSLYLPLATHGPSGAEYRLRDATFEISSQYYYYDSGGEGGAAPTTITVSSESDPAASAISVSLERGYYYVRLLSGWRLEKVEGGDATDVEATLLSNASQWVHVAQHSSSWVTYQFGLGERSIWFNGDLSIAVQVYEKPSDLYGGGGAAGESPTGVGGQP